jgi:hypothetical protein
MTTHVQTTLICPETHAELAIDLPADDRDLSTYWAQTVSVECPVCNRRHVNSYSELYRRGTMAPFLCSEGPVLLH